MKVSVWAKIKKGKHKGGGEDTASKSKQNLPFINKILMNRWHHSTA